MSGHGRPLLCTWNAGGGPALTSLALVRSRGRVPRAELGRRIRVLDPNLAQSLRTFIISKPKFEHVASTGELHISVGIQAKSCNEGASAEVRFCPIHGRFSVSGISVGHGNSDAPTGPTNAHHRTTLELRRERQFFFRVFSTASAISEACWP